MDTIQSVALLVANVLMLMTVAIILRKAERTLDAAEHALEMNRLTEEHVGKQIRNLLDYIDCVERVLP